MTTEIDRVAETTKFNETYLLKGEDGTKTINLGAHDAGLKGKITDNGDGTATFVMNELKAGDSVSIGGKNYTIGSTADDAKNLITAGTNKDMKTYTINGTVFKADDTKVYRADGTTELTKGDLGDTANKATLTDLQNFAAKAGSKVSDGTTTLTVMNDEKDADGNAKADGIDDNNPSIISKSKAYEYAKNELLAANSIGDTEGNVGVTNTDNTFTINVAQAKVANSLSFSLHVGSDADMTNKIQVSIDSMDTASLGIKGINVKDDSGNAATYAIDAISDAISKVSSQRSSLGAVQNRLEHTINNLDNVVENTTTAESRIRDTDMAEEMVNYSKNNILAQAGQSMLAQANQSNQGVLSLLQ